MVTSKRAADIIKKIVERRYAAFTISVLGKKLFTPEQLAQLEKQGVNISNSTSLLELAYFHNLLNPHGKVSIPKTVPEMKKQQGVKGVIPSGEHPTNAVEMLNETTLSAIEKLKQDSLNRIMGFIRDNNQSVRFSALQEDGQKVNSLLRNNSLTQLKQKLRDSSGDANRDWSRIATTELSNAIGIGSVDRIANETQGTDSSEVYVYRIVVNDAALCKYCKRFYQGSDGAPKVYRLSTLLANGSNYGKKAADWSPVVGATHPNERCSQVIELKPGWKVLPGGKQTFIGLEAWTKYIAEKVTA